MHWLPFAMVQSINTKAILSIATIIRRPYLASPHVPVNTVSEPTLTVTYGQEVKYESLRDHAGIRAVVFDKDNTLTGPYETKVHPLAEDGLNSALHIFGRSNVAILSNSAGTRDDIDYLDAEKIEKEMGIAVIRHDEKKPGGLNEVMDHFDNVDDPSQICMVGDRLLTDIVFGNLYGMLTIHCLPLCSGKDNAKDNAIASIIRKTENTLLYGNWWGGRAVRSKTPTHKVWDGTPLSTNENSSDK